MTTLDGKRARLHAPRDLRFEVISVDPEHLGPGEICAATEYSTVSIGTEKAAYVGAPPLRPGPVYPRLLGYCNAARVVGVAADVKSVSAGDRILTHQSHQSCFVCPAADVLAKLPTNLDSRAASATYIAHLGLNALQRAGFRPGETVVVQGLGPIGLATVALARAVCARRVIAIGNDAGRLAKAVALGATSALDASAADLPQRVLDAGGGVLGDVVVTTVNAWSAWRTTLAIVREHGRIAVLGFPGRGEGAPPFNPFESETFYTKQPSVLSVGLAAGPGIWGDGDRVALRRENMDLLVGLVADGKVAMGELITHEVPWSELESIYRLAEAGDKAMISAVLRWGDAR